MVHAGCRSFFMGHIQLAAIVRILRESIALLSELVYVLAGQGQNHVKFLTE